MNILGTCKYMHLKNLEMHAKLLPVVSLENMRREKSKTNLTFLFYILLDYLNFYNKHTLLLSLKIKKLKTR